MLSIQAGTSSRNCDGLSRRDCLRVGTLALGGLTLPQLLESNAWASNGNKSFVRDKSVVLLYLSGGASHIETFDPKMTAAAGVCSVTGEVKSSIPGVTFGGTFPELAKHADKMAIVRSFTHDVGSHEQAHVHMLSGGTDPRGQQKQGFSIGSCCTRLRGTNHPLTGMPTYALLTELEIDGQYQKEIGRVRKGSWPGSLGRMFAPLEHQLGWQATPSERNHGARPIGSGGGNPLIADMQLNLTAAQLKNRLQLLGSIDKLKRNVDNSGAMASLDKFSAQALDLVLGGAADAFDIAQESTQLVERYDTSHIRIGHKQFRPSTLGQQMLVARRLCEAGCGFVTIHSAGWDMHADGNNPGIKLGMERLGRSLDKAVSAFLEDVGRRGLSEKILLVITGDFGRTPKLNSRGGRDHWAKLGTLAFAGGGLRMGQVIGTSAANADEPASHAVSTPELMATVLHTIFDIGRLRLEPGIPRDLARLVDGGRPIAQLF